MTHKAVATPTEIIARASQAPLRASVKRSSIEAMRLTSRRLRPESARLAARNAGSKICSFSDKGSAVVPWPRSRVEANQLLLLALVAFARFASNRTGFLPAREVDFPVDHLFAAFVGRNDDGFHGAQHTLAQR